jgi:hypothetical protein
MLLGFPAHSTSTPIYNQFLASQYPPLSKLVHYFTNSVSMKAKILNECETRRRCCTHCGTVRRKQRSNHSKFCFSLERANFRQLLCCSSLMYLLIHCAPRVANLFKNSLRHIDAICEVVDSTVIQKNPCLTTPHYTSCEAY